MTWPYPDLKLPWHFKRAGESDQYIYGVEVLCAWDFSVSKKVDADDYQGNLSQTYRDLLHDAQMKAAREQRTNSEKLSLFLRKVVGFSQYLLVQGVSFVLIIAVSLEAANISVEISKSFPGVRLFVDLANLNTSLTHSLTLSLSF